MSSPASRPSWRPAWRTRTVAVVAGLAAALVVALVLTLDGGGSARPNSPEAAAAAWGRAALDRDTGALKRLSCPSATQGFGVYGLILSGSDVRAGAPLVTGSLRWSVPITTTGSGGGTSLRITVVEQHGTYLVC